MPDKIDFKVDFPRFRKAIDKFATIYGVTVKEVMQIQFGLWIKDIVKKTYPTSAAKGKRAIERDYRKLFVPIETAQKLKFYKQKFGKTLPDTFQTEWTANEVSAYHNANRDNRGRVRKQQASNEKIGGYTFRKGKMYVTQRALNKALRDSKSHVGKLVSGWIRAIDLFRVTVANWVRANSGDGFNRGDAGDRMKDNGSGFLFAENQTPYADRLNGIVESGLRTRERDLYGAAIKRLDKDIERWNNS